MEFQQREPTKVQPQQKRSPAPSKFQNQPNSVKSMYLSSDEDDSERFPSNRVQNNSDQDLNHEVLFYWKEMDVQKSSADSA